MILDNFTRIISLIGSFIILAGLNHRPLISFISLQEE